MAALVGPVLVSNRASIPLNQNTGFETGVPPWIATNSASLSQSPAWSYQGSNSALVTGNGTVANPDMVSEMITVPIGRYFVFSAVLYSPQGWGSAAIQLNYFSGGTYESGYYPASPVLTAGVATRVTIMDPAPTAFPQTQLVVALIGTPATSVQLFADDVTFTGLLCGR
jgi:hypothetical protein